MEFQGGKDTVQRNSPDCRHTASVTPQYNPVTPGMPCQGQLPGHTRWLTQASTNHTHRTNNAGTREAGIAAARTVATLASAAPRSPSRHISQTQTRTRTAKPNRSAPPSQWASGNAARNGGTVNRFTTLRSRQSCRAQGRSHQINTVCSQKGCSITAAGKSEMDPRPLEPRPDHPVNPDGSNPVYRASESNLPMTVRRSTAQVRLFRSGTIIGASTRAIRGRKKNRTEGTARRLSNFSASRRALSL